MRTRRGVPPAMARAISPRRQAPAVCDEDGPTMVGPRMSKSETMGCEVRGAARPAPCPPLFTVRSTRCEVRSRVSADGGSVPRTPYPVPVLVAVALRRKPDSDQLPPGQPLAAHHQRHPLLAALLV